MGEKVWEILGKTGVGDTQFSDNFSFIHFFIKTSHVITFWTKNNENEA